MRVAHCNQGILSAHASGFLEAGSFHTKRLAFTLAAEAATAAPEGGRLEGDGNLGFPSPGRCSIEERAKGSLFNSETSSGNTQA